MEVETSSVFTAGRQQAALCLCRFPKLPESGNVCAMFGPVVALHKQLRETESRGQISLHVYLTGHFV